MRTIKLRSWGQFSRHLVEVRRRRDELEMAEHRPFDAPLFRGVGSSKWGLETTLERSVPLELAEAICDLPTYYGYVTRSKSSIETLTDADWGALPNPPDF